jgi:hypothetical protein
LRQPTRRTAKQAIPSKAVPTAGLAGRTAVGFTSLSHALGDSTKTRSVAFESA